MSGATGDRTLAGARPRQRRVRLKNKGAREPRRPSSGSRGSRRLRYELSGRGLCPRYDLGEQHLLHRQRRADLDANPAPRRSPASPKPCATPGAGPRRRRPGSANARAQAEPEVGRTLSSTTSKRSVWNRVHWRRTAPCRPTRRAKSKANSSPPLKAAGAGANVKRSPARGSPRSSGWGQIIAHGPVAAAGGRLGEVARRAAERALRRREGARCGRRGPVKRSVTSATSPGTPPAQAGA